VAVLALVGIDGRVDWDGGREGRESLEGLLSVIEIVWSHSLVLVNDGDGDIIAAVAGDCRLVGGWLISRMSFSGGGGELAFAVTVRMAMPKSW